MSNRFRQPTVYVIAGPHGAGKTTFATEFLPDFVNCREFLNAETIATGLSPFAPESQYLRAGRLLLERIRELSKAGEDFGLETTLAGRMHVKLLTKLQRWGYRIDLFFLWLPSADLAVRRVAGREAEGGRAVAEEVVRRRYASGLRNLFQLYGPRVDALWIYDSSCIPSTQIVRFDKAATVAMDSELYTWVRTATEGQFNG
jgi:predicted ABC-type ATPase